MTTVHTAPGGPGTALLAEPLYAIGHTAVARVAGPLLVIEDADDVGYGEFVEVTSTGGATGEITRRGQVLEIDGTRAVIQVFGGTSGIGRTGTTVLSRGRPARTGVGLDYLGRILDGTGRPRDGGPEPIAAELREVTGLPLNPVARDHPDQFIETGISAIDALLTVVRGQKLPVFSGYGLPADELAARIATQARVPRRGRRVRGGVRRHGRDPAHRGLLHRPPRRRRGSGPIGAVAQPRRGPHGGTDPHPPGRPHHRRVPRLRPRHARPGGAHRHDQLLRGAPRNLGGPGGTTRPARLPGLHVHGPGHDLRARRARPRPVRVPDPAAHPVHARRRHQPPGSRPDRLTSPKARSCCPGSCTGRASSRRSTCCPHCPG